MGQGPVAERRGYIVERALGAYCRRSLGLAVRVATLFFDQRLSTIVGDLIGIVVDVIVLIYLFQPRVAFRQA